MSMDERGEPSGSLDALSVPKDVFKTQKRAASTLAAYPLSTWISKEPVISAWVQMKIATERKEIVVLHALATHPSILPRTARALLALERTYITTPLAANPCVDYKDLSPLADKNLHPQVAAALLKNPSLGRAQRELFLSKAWGEAGAFWRMRFMSNLVLTRDDIEPDEFENYRAMPGGLSPLTYLQSPSLPADEKARLIREGSAEELQAMALNPSLNEKDMEALLARDSDSIVSNLIVANLGKLPSRVIDLMLDLDAGMPAEVLETLAEAQADILSDDQMLKIVERVEDGLSRAGSDNAVALLCEFAPKLPPELVEYCFRGKAGSYAKMAVISRAEIPVEYLAEVYERKDLGEMVRLMENPSLPQWLQVKLAFDSVGDTHVARRLSGGLTGNPSLQLSHDFPLKFVSRLRKTSASPYDSRGDGRKANRLAARALLAKLGDEIAPDFITAFEETWEGSISDFIAFAKALDV